MKKILLIAFLFFLSKTEAQPFFLNCSRLEFSSVAPSPWAINGQINDWETILGTVNMSNPIFPFGPSIVNNGGYDTYGANDPDVPDPKSDLRVIATIHDDVNIFLYFRRLDNNNFPNKAFYFFDINIDGLMNNGEPVLAVQFNSKHVNKLSICRYIPLNIAGDPIGGNNPNRISCYVDGFSMKGQIAEIFNSHNTSLLPGEIFSGATTENGYGIELAVPWRFISQYKYFAYRVALQKGAGNYNPENPSDNASGCNIPLTSIIGDPDLEVQESSVTTIIPGSSFRVDLVFKNNTPAELQGDIGAISIKNIVQRNNLQVNETEFGIRVFGPDPYTYFSGSFSSQPILYIHVNDPNSGIFLLAPFATKTVPIYITFPSNNSVKNATFEFEISGKFRLVTICVPNTGGGGGKPINPIGIELGDETNTGAIKNKSAEAESSGGFENRIRVYPNPSSGNFNVVLPNSDSPFEMTLTDYTGKMIRKWSGVRQSTFRIENLKQGFYLLNIYSKEGRLLGVKKLISQ